MNFLTDAWYNYRKDFVMAFARVVPVGAMWGEMMASASSEKGGLANLGAWLTTFDCLGFFLECALNAYWSCIDCYEESEDEGKHDVHIADGKVCAEQEKRAALKYILNIVHMGFQIPNAVNWVASNIDWGTTSSSSSGEPSFTPQNLKCFGYSIRLAAESMYDFPQGVKGDFAKRKAMVEAREVLKAKDDLDKKRNLELTVDDEAKARTAIKEWESYQFIARFASGCFYFNIALEVLAHCWPYFSLGSSSGEGSGSEKPDEDKDGEDVWPSHDAMQQTNLAAGIVYFLAVTANFPNHQNTRVPLCTKHCKSEFYTDLCKADRKVAKQILVKKVNKDLSNVRAVELAARSKCQESCEPVLKILKQQGIYCDQNGAKALCATGNFDITETLGTIHLEAAADLGYTPPASKPPGIVRQTSSDLISDPDMSDID